MSRRRAADKIIPISIGIPSSLNIRLEELLDYNQSRSKWVVEAIESKLKAADALELIDDIDLVYEMFSRKFITIDHYDRIRAKLKRQVEETATTQ
tara:strand:- start:266 stop:550 length:285 start_codon:yes stop_codon:yes gene_type:complete